jgi:hypothetical protein
MASARFTFVAFLDRGWTAPARAPTNQKVPPRSISGDAMSESDKPSQPPAPASSSLSPHKAAEKQRRAEALRENLKRRKTQARGRRGDSGGNSGPVDEEGL